MSGVELVVAALTAGASAGLTDTASSAVRDAYDALRQAVRRRLGADARILEAQESEPALWQAELTTVLAQADADRDQEVVAAAEALLRELGRHPSAANVVDARDAKGVQIGDGNTQTNTFN
ncbi:hypothetical protein ACFXOD_04635 [Streptomyces sp. NPDC059161]|uniref:hypothetical protein n=1 Tax=Streptomyces sp. NPDC059161 TaxID=3346749 RepID=UPI0036A6917C